MGYVHINCGTEWRSYFLAAFRRSNRFAVFRGPLSTVQSRHTGYGPDGNPRPLLLWFEGIDGKREGPFSEERHNRVVPQSDGQPYERRARMA